MASIDERVVAMSFENSKFEANIATTMASLGKLDKAIAGIGKVNGLASIEASASKVTLLGPMSALDKLKAKLGFATAGTTFSDMEKASSKVTFLGPMSALDKLKQKLGFTNAGSTFSDMERAADKVTLSGPMSALDKLKAKLGLATAGTTFSDMERAADRVSFSGLTKAIDGIGSHFSATTVAIGVALGGLVSQVAQKTAAMAKSITLDPIIGGFQEYGTNLQSIQTILANTQDSGGNLKTVNAALQDLNTYSDKTIYNFSQMAANIGTFTAAGVRLKPATAAIKGIANLAALSGSNSQQASSAMYQLSQAIAAGKVGLQDWNSVVNAGMGGAVFQKALMRTAENMGAIKQGAVQIDKATGKATINGQSFRESIMAKPGEQSWLTSDVLTKTLGQFTGDMSDAQLAAQGFTQDQIKAIQATAKSAQAAATQVKTLPQVFDVARETIGSGWAKTFQTIFGNFGEAKGTFTALSNTINGFINQNAQARNKVLSDWKDLGGRTELISGIKAAFQDVVAVLKPVKDAFREIFPANTGKDLFEMTKRFHDFMVDLKPGAATVENIKRTFAGFFAVLHIGWTIIKATASAIFSLIGATGVGSGGFLNFTGSIGDFLVALDKAISRGGVFKGVFSGLVAVLKVPLALIQTIAGAIGKLFGIGTSGGADKFSGSMDGVRKALGPMAGVLDTVVKAWNGFIGILDKVKTAVSPLLDDIGKVVSNFGDVVANGIANANYDKVFAAINTVLIGGIFLAIKKAIGGGISVDFGGGVIKKLSETLSVLTGNLKAMQQNVQAKTLLAIAAAIVILAAGVFLLSTIDPKRLASSMAAIAVGMGELVAAMAILNKAAGGTAFVRMPFIAGSMILLSTALLLLASAAKIFATMSWEQIAKGLFGIAGSLTAVGVATQFMSGPKILVTAAALLPLAVALNILALAVKLFATMSWEQLIKGLAGVAGALIAISVGVTLMPPTLPLIGLGLIAVGAGLTLLSAAVASFGALKLTTLVQGLVGIAGALVVLGTAITAIPPTIALQAAGLILVAVGLTALSGAIAILGNMKIGTLVKGIIAMGGALVVLGLGLTAMSGTLLGSAALLAAAAALAILAPTLAFLGNLRWSTIFKGLAAVALTLGTLAVAGALAAGPLVVLGVALGVLGLGLTAIAGAVFLFAKGISLLKEGAVKALAALVAAFGAFMLIFPKMVIDFVKGIVVILEQVVLLAPKIISSLVSITTQLLDAIIKLTPKIAEAIGSLITGIVNILDQNAGPLIRAGFGIVLNLLTGIGDNIGKVSDQAIRIVLGFIHSLSGNAPSLTAAGAGLLVAFLAGIAGKFPSLIAVAALVVVKFVENIARHIPKIVAAGANLVTSFLVSIASQIGRIISAGVNVIISFLGGVQKAIPRIKTRALDVARTFLNNLSDGLLGLVDIGFRALIRFLNGLARAIRENNDKVYRAGWNVAAAIGEGMLHGLSFVGPRIISAIGHIISALPKKALSLLGIGSPSKVFMEIGRFTTLGLAKGLEDGAAGVDKAIVSVADHVVSRAQEKFGNMPDILNGLTDMEPVISPVLDLSNVKREAAKLSDVIVAPPIVAATSLGQATTIADQKQAVDVATAVTPVVAAPASVFNYEQNLYSPDPLSNIEIYRQTNNQLSRIKGLVGVQ